MKKLIYGILPALVVFGCSKQEFDTIPESKQTAQQAKWNAKVDFLILVDDSTSMLKYQERFATEMPAMLESLKKAGIDYHFAVITTTMSTKNGGRFVGEPRFLDEKTPNMLSLLQSRIRAGQVGSDVERGFEAIMKSLSKDYLSKEGAGFLRDEALLSLILVTNETDYSNINPKTITNYLDALKPPIQAQRTTYRNWNANHLGILPNDPSCRTTDEVNEPTEDYMLLADYSGGVNSSICDTSFAKAVSSIQKRLIEVMTDFPLDKTPIIETLKVYNNGEPVANDPINGWTYEADGNLIRFHGSALPGPDANITIDYKPASGS